MKYMEIMTIKLVGKLTLNLGKHNCETQNLLKVLIIRIWSMVNLTSIEQYGVFSWILGFGLHMYNTLFHYLNRDHYTIMYFSI